VRLRFHGIKRTITEAEAINMTDIDFAEHVALVATCGNPVPQLIGVCRYIICDSKHHRAEIAFAVLDEHQGKGIGSMLLRHLAIIARSQGIQEFLADVLAENRPMLAVFERSGFRLKHSSEYGVDRVLLRLEDGPNK